SLPVLRRSRVPGFPPLAPAAMVQTARREDPRAAVHASPRGRAPRCRTLAPARQRGFLRVFLRRSQSALRSSWFSHGVLDEGTDDESASCTVASAPGAPPKRRISDSAACATDGASAD